MTDPTNDQDFVDNLKTLVVSLVQDALVNTDPRQRTRAIRWLGLMKYDDERRARVEAPRSDGHEVLYQIAINKLPIINEFIDTADAEQLRHLLEGMVHGLNVHMNLQAPDTESDHEEAVASDHAPDAASIDSPAPSFHQDVMLGLISNFDQNHDVDRRRRAGRGIGSLKHGYERGLRLSSGSTDTAGLMAIHAPDALAAVDQLVATADADQLRDIIEGFTEYREDSSNVDSKAS